MHGPDEGEAPRGLIDRLEKGRRKKTPPEGGRKPDGDLDLDRIP